MIKNTDGQQLRNIFTVTRISNCFIIINTEWNW